MAWSQRFFWLPTVPRADIVSAVGTTTRIASNPLGTGYYGPLFAWWDGDHRNAASNYGDLNHWLDLTGQANAYSSMACYAVTIDVTKVPLSETIMTSDQTFNASDGVPRFGYYNTGSPFYMACAYTSTAPQGTNDSRGPFLGFNMMRPWAFSVYETKGVTSIASSQFITPGGNYDATPKALYTKRRIGVNQMMIWTGGSWAAMGNCGLAPFCCYVLRPSTGAIVGWLYVMWNAGGYGPGGTAECTNASNPSTAGAIIKNSKDQPYNFDAMWSVSGMQDGDLIVWEWWHQFRGSLGGNMTYVTGGSWRSVVQTYWGGGLSGQPLTYNGGGGPTIGATPDYAPSQGSTLTNMSGIEPGGDVFIDVGTRFNRPYNKPINWGFN